VLPRSHMRGGGSIAARRTSTFRRASIDRATTVCQRKFYIGTVFGGSGSRGTGSPFGSINI